MSTTYEEAVSSFEWDVPDDFALPNVLADHAAEFGNRLAVRFRHEDGWLAERTFGEIHEDAQRFANALADLGVDQGDRVMHLFPRHPDAFAIQAGVLARGALLVPCSAMLQSKDVSFRAEDCEATTVVVHESLTDMVEQALDETALETVVVLDANGDPEPENWHAYGSLVDDQSTDHDGPDLAADDPMSINYTSGTTGRPKPVLHKHRWLHCFERVNGPYWWGVDRDTDVEDELLWATTGTGWAKWFWSPVGVALVTGAPQFVYEGEFDAGTYLDLLESEGVTRLCAVPTQYRMFTQRDDLDDYDLALAEALSAGEPLNREPIAAFEDAFGLTPRDGYGQTETVALVTNYPGIDVKPGSMGKPAPGVGTTIIDTRDEEEVDVGETGEIAVPIDSPAIFDGYYESPDLDDRTFHGDYYRTGDLARRDEDGYFFFEGRADDIIISSGYRIGPFEVEDALVGHDAVAEAAAVASPHDERGNVVKAYVVLADGHDGSDDLVDDLQDYMKSETAPYKYPRRIEFVDELPTTSSGKIRRIELREREQSKFGE
ncbi:acyl-CoA synthetase [Halobacterium jilantaiense]|uniref:Acetyl-CoA synthetase n=1 Tax=Halobacterium jilantaiense TaxID=355548 RepID=A0A1I0MLV0_9EURY|nr:AMP-binding protein [Halobacterium jilantaiense]SEV89141.1 acetyl-CoA synthetase [Halobacterium jilantaiense]